MMAPLPGWFETTERYHGERHWRHHDFHAIAIVGDIDDTVYRLWGMLSNRTAGPFPTFEAAAAAAEAFANGVT